MISAQLTAAEAAGRVWRVGFRPEPWAWSGWEWATDGRFPGRWDDLHGNFRTIYAGSSLLACLLEVLAHFRKDARLSVELDEIVEDDEDKVLHPTIAPGQVPTEWLEVRAAASAELSGRYCVRKYQDGQATHCHLPGWGHFQMPSWGQKDLTRSHHRSTNPRLAGCPWTPDTNYPRVGSSVRCRFRVSISFWR